MSSWRHRNFPEAGWPGSSEPSQLPHQYNVQPAVRRPSADSGYDSNLSTSLDLQVPAYSDEAANSLLAASFFNPIGTQWGQSTPYGIHDTLQSMFPTSQVSSASISSRHTPASLDWSQYSALYRLIVPKGQEPYFELLEGYYATPATPGRVYLDYPTTLEKSIFPCQYPNCDSRVRNFKRPADLERHYRNVHALLDQKEEFECDYSPCQKSRAPFTRKDHFRDHLRDYHKEDIGSAKGEKKPDKKKWRKIQEAWLAERSIKQDWWRCPKCLIRVTIAEYVWKCPICNNEYDIERVKRIQAVRARTPPGPPLTDNEDVSYTQYDETPSAATRYSAYNSNPYNSNPYYSNSSSSAAKLTGYSTVETLCEQHPPSSRDTPFQTTGSLPCAQTSSNSSGAAASDTTDPDISASIAPSSGTSVEQPVSDALYTLPSRERNHEHPRDHKSKDVSRKSFLVKPHRRDLENIKKR